MLNLSKNWLLDYALTIFFVGLGCYLADVFIAKQEFQEFEALVIGNVWFFFRRYVCGKKIE
jgi:hypothetical protein